MGRHDRIAIPAAEREVGERADHYGVLVGWSHTPCGVGINLKVQSAVSQSDLREGKIDAHNFLMTRNQALLLARYLLDSTDQSIEPLERPRGWRALWSRAWRR